MATVLLVDDRRVVLELMEAVLADTALRLLTAGSGQSALAALHREPVEVLVSDLEMPVMDGLALLKRARDLPARKKMRAVLCCAPADRLKCLAGGADAVVDKPLTARPLLEAVGRFVALQKRAQLRVAARLPVAWKLGGLAGAGETRNLSLSGAFIRGAVLPPNGATGELLIESAGTAYRFGVTVVRGMPGAGFAVEFAVADAALIERFADDLEGRLVRAVKT